MERETARTGRKLTQRDFVLGLIEQALDEAESSPDSEACVAPGPAPEEPDDAQPQEEDDPASLSA